jgi:cytoskeletal protein CcmA (bactofilin family)
MGKNEFNAFLGGGTSYQGRLTFHGVVRIDGEFDGEIISDGTLMVGKDARVSGVLQVARLFCGGLVEAEVAASGTVVLHKSGVFRGELRTPALVVEDGAKIEGRVVMGQTQATDMGILSQGAESSG